MILQILRVLFIAFEVVVLFNLLTGRLPHRAASMSELMFQIANHAPPDVRELRPDLPETLADVVTLALENEQLVGRLRASLEDLAQ